MSRAAACLHLLGLSWIQQAGAGGGTGSDVKSDGTGVSFFAVLVSGGRACAGGGAYAGGGGANLVVVARVTVAAVQTLVVVARVTVAAVQTVVAARVMVAAVRSMVAQAGL